MASPKKKTPRSIPHNVVTKGQALAMLLADLRHVSDRIKAATAKMIEAQKDERAALAEHETTIGKLALFMREHGLKAARCDGLLVTDMGDRITIQPDHYTDLSN